jgi:signal transduction histidine kinase
MSDTDKMINDLKLEIERLKADNSALLKLASHDVRSPLNKVFALVNLLKMADGSLSDEQLDYIANIEMVLSDGLHHMRNLMDLRAIENEAIKMHLEVLEIGSVVKRVVREQVPLAERKRISLKMKESSINTNSDRLIIIRILDQLLSNALKFSPENTEVGVFLDDGNDYFSISVVDGGYGISENEQTELFKKFKVLSTTSTGGESKTGLGLFIAQQYARKLGGSIRYDNSDKSTFILELPKMTLA